MKTGAVRYVLSRLLSWFMFKQSSNKVETIIKTSEEPQSPRLNGSQRLKECSLILGVLFSILLAVALLTFSRRSIMVANGVGW